MARLKLGDLMVRAGLIDEMQLRSALAHQKRWGGRLGDILVDRGFLDEEMLWRGLSKQLNVPFISLRDHKVDPGVLGVLPLSLAAEHGVFPIQATDRELRIATADPQDLQAQDEIGFKTNRRVSIVLAPTSQIEWAIDRHYRKQDAPCPAFRKRRMLPSEEGPPIRDDDWADGETKGDNTRPTLSTIPQPAPIVSVPPTPAYAQPPSMASRPPTPAPLQYAGASSATATPLSALTAMQQQASSHQQQVQQMQLTRVETELRQTTRFLRLVVDACVERGLFTREEYLGRIRS
jgi:type II secretory ATPase GspE/PulE/Tfp pilus assembly ATPase PilB-like protein